MKYLKLYESFDKNEIDAFCKAYHIINYFINEDGSIDVKGQSVHIYNLRMEKIPIKFNIVDNSFDCTGVGLTTLENCPRSVGDNFYCSYNKLTSLEYSPDYVGGVYQCNGNRLTTLVGATQRVKYFHAENNNLLDVYGFPEFLRSEKGICLAGNPVNTILRLVPIKKQKRFIGLLNDYQAIRGTTIIQDRLEEALYGVGEKLFRKYELK